MLPSSLLLCIYLINVLARIWSGFVEDNYASGSE